MQHDYKGTYLQPALPHSLPQVLQESMAVTVDRILARSTLRERAEAEASARDAQLASECRKGTGGPSERLVPSLEELVAEKAEELRIRSLDRSARMNDDDGSSAGGGLDRDSGEGVGGFGKADGDQDSTLGMQARVLLLEEDLNYQT